MVTFWQAVLRSGQFSMIDHKFPEVGHSYMDSDRDFGIIENKMRKVERIYSPEEYRSLIKESKLKQKFVVQNIANGLIDAKKLVIQMKLIQRQKQRNDKKEIVQFRKIRWFRFEKIGFYKYRMSFDENEEWKTVDIRGRGFKEDVNVDLTSAELSVIPGQSISAAKVADIKKQLPYIPRIHHRFYNSISGIEQEESGTSNDLNESDQDSD